MMARRIGTGGTRKQTELIRRTVGSKSMESGITLMNRVILILDGIIILFMRLLVKGRIAGKRKQIAGIIWMIPVKC